MRKLENFIKIVVLTIVMIVVLCIADLIALAYFGMKSESGYVQIAPAYLSEQIDTTVNQEGEVQYHMSQQGLDRIDAFDGFAFILDDTGNVVWSYRLPDDVPRQYTIRDIVQFTRFYLNDYPVYTRIVDNIVLVIGLPRLTVWKYNLTFKISTIDRYMSIMPFFLVINVVILLLGPFLIIRRDAHKREMQRTSWIAGVSHDIRTPLSLVLGYADELLHLDENSIDTEDVIEWGQMIKHQAIRIKTLVTNLNTSNKLTYGMGVWHREKVLLPALIRESMCEVLNRNLDDKYDISVTISETLEQFYVNGDRELITRLIENLINNAINHNPQGGEIKVSLTCQSLWIIKKIVLKISDNGCGVSREQLKKFRSAVKSDKLQEHGLGIRLVRQIASFHHWTVQFSSNENGGLCCKIYI